MKPKHPHQWRYTVLIFLLIGFCLVFAARLVNLQIASHDLYAVTDVTTTTRTVKIQAHRGEVFDRNGLPLITNAISYSLIFDYAAMPDSTAEANESILAALRALDDVGETAKRKDIPFPFTGTYPNLKFDQAGLSAATIQTRHARVLADNNCKADMPLAEQIAFFAKKYRLLDSEGEPLYDPETMTALLAIRYDMEVKRFSRVEPYVLAEDVSLALITCVKERQIIGTAFHESVERVYTYPGYASHILGRTGKIQTDEDMAYYTALGYPMDAVVGISGVEKAFETYLAGQDGELTIVEDENGEIVDTYVSREPVAGRDIRLTIDIGMQIAAEDALAANLDYIHAKAAATEGDQDGEDAAAGALTAVNVHTGEIYAIASNPTYNLATFSADFAALNSDANRPMINRALSGQYPPGSTFKIGVAAAALTEGIITPDTTIETKGIYEYYAPTFTPRCWLYLRYGANHGTINVTKALQVSCNYFFYEVGRLLTIEKMNQYMRSYGLGEPTGIELAERLGVLAGPEYRETSGREPWTAGDTVQAAIGQSDNLLTPMQLSVYMATIANGGTRYAAHLLHSVYAFGADQPLQKIAPSIISRAELSARDYGTLMTALRSVTEDDGSAARIFADYPIEVGGKTGTAQVSKTRSDNAVFTAFAPWSSPEIAVSCVIENGANGTDAGVSVREVFDYYFKLGDYAPPAEPTPEDGTPA